MREEHRAELDELEARLDRARSMEDHAAAVGSVKDLVEATAKIVMAERSVTFGDETKAPELIDKALRALELPPRLARPGEEDLEALIGGLADAGRAVFRLRNRIGIGHGRTTSPEADANLVRLAVRGAQLWVEWAIDRLAVLQVGDVDQLITDLDGAIFRRGSLAQRFVEVRLYSLDPDDQARLGVAVAGRCRRETGVVIADGLEAVVRDVDRWPRRYRTGLIEGLLLNSQGQLHPTFLPELIVLLGGVDRDEWEFIVDAARAAPWSLELAADPSAAHRLREQMHELTIALPPGIQSSWHEISGRLPSSALF